VKKPTDLPREGDRVRLRGRGITGTVRDIHPQVKTWTWVDWDDCKTGPLIVHLYELEKLDE